MNDTVYQVFDITNPATYEYFEQLYQKLTFQWGYTYHKLDFTRAAINYEDADFFDKSVTLAQAYYKAVSAIRKGMGEESYFLMCGGLYDPIIGLVDAQRTGSDVLSMWSSTIQKNGKTAPYTIKQSMFRYYMNYWWDNDPDALMIRKNEIMERNLRLTYGLPNDEEVKTVVVKQKNKPLVVKSNGHYSMGGEIEFLAWESEKLQYCIKNAFDVPLDYEILLPNKQVISLQIPKGRREIL